MTQASRGTLCKNAPGPDRMGFAVIPETVRLIFRNRKVIGRKPAMQLSVDTDTSDVQL